MGGGKTPVSPSSKGRLLSLDAIKGIAILMVILGHVRVYWKAEDGYLAYSYLIQYIQAIHMPLFMLIAGFFATKKPELTLGSLSHYWRDKAVRLLLPAVLWMLLMTLWQRGVPTLAGILWREYWFTLTLFIYFAIFLLQRWVVDGVLGLFGLSQRRWFEAGGHLLLTGGLSLFCTYFLEHYRLPSAGVESVIRTLPCLYPYFVVGYLLKRLELLDYLKSHVAGAVSFVLLLLSLGILRYKEADVPYLQYGLFHYCRVMALASFAFLVYAMTALTEGGGRVSRALVFLGQWSLPIYLTHYFFLPSFYGVESFLGLLWPDRRLGMELTIYTLGIVLTLLFTLPTIWLLKRNPYLDYAFYGEIGRLKK